MRGLDQLRNTAAPADAWENHRSVPVSPGLLPSHCNKLTVVRGARGKAWWIPLAPGCSPLGGGQSQPGRTTGESGRAQAPGHHTRDAPRPHSPAEHPGTRALPEMPE